VQVVFDEQYFSSMSVVVQATLLDFRFRLKTFKSVQSELAALQREARSSEKKKRPSLSLSRKNQIEEPMAPIEPPTPIFIP
jgi:hypothetical protein